MGFKIRINTKDAMLYAKQLFQIAQNYQKLSNEFMNEMNDMKDVWEGLDAEAYMNQTIELAKDLSMMCNKFTILSNVIKSSVSNYIKRIEENIRAIRSKLK